MSVIGVIPAAGFGTRLRGSAFAAPAASKEMLPIRGRPVIGHLVERMRAVSCDDIRVICRPDKHDLVAWVTDSGLTVVTGQPRNVAESVYLGLDGLDPADLVLVGFPDTVWAPLDGFAVLSETLERDSTADAVLGVFGSDEPERGDVVELGAGGRITRIVVKPDRPASRLIWGCAVCRRGSLDGLDEEAEPGRWFDRAARFGRIVGLHLSDDFVDIGTVEALARERGMTS